jgi:hypothetical protein
MTNIKHVDRSPPNDRIAIISVASILPQPACEFVEIAAWSQRQSPTYHGLTFGVHPDGWHAIAIDRPDILPHLQLFHLYQAPNAGRCLLSCRLMLKSTLDCPPIRMSLGLVTGCYDRFTDLEIQPPPTWQEFELQYDCQPQSDFSRIVAQLHLPSPNTQLWLRSVELYQAPVRFDVAS